MLIDEIDELLNEYSDCSSADPELRLVDAALFVEECFGLALTDADIGAANLGSRDAIRKFVLERAGS